VAALEKFVEATGTKLSEWAAVGDSITDARMLTAAHEAGGLAIAFNGNEYVIPYATMSLASTSIADLLEVFRAWQKGGRKSVEKLVKDKEKSGGKGDRENFAWICGRTDLDEIIGTHKRIRRLVREEAAGLG